MNDDLNFFQLWIMVVSAISLCTSFVALFVSWISARRTNASVVRLLDCSGYTHCSASVPESHRFQIVLRNLGLPLQDVRVGILIVRKDGGGSINFVMTQYSMRDGSLIRASGEFTKGMVAKFELRSEDPYMATFTPPPCRTTRYLIVEAGSYNRISLMAG